MTNHVVQKFFGPSTFTLLFLRTVQFGSKCRPRSFYSLIKIWWNFNWAEFLWINTNFSFEVSSYFGQSVDRLLCCKWTSRLAWERKITFDITLWHMTCDYKVQWHFPSSFYLSNISQNFPTAAKLSFSAKLSNFKRNFPTSRSYQLPVPTTRIPRVDTVQMKWCRVVFSKFKSEHLILISKMT